VAEHRIAFYATAAQVIPLLALALLLQLRRLSPSSSVSQYVFYIAIFGLGLAEFASLKSLYDGSDPADYRAILVIVAITVAFGALLVLELFDWALPHDTQRAKERQQRREERTAQRRDP
jgi:hypothetical protein